MGLDIKIIGLGSIFTDVSFEETVFTGVNVKVYDHRPADVE